MIIIPDLFSPYVEGVETARKANWDDLTKYNTVQKGQLDNLFALATFSPKVNREFENTDKLALENLFNEENFQNKLLDEILDNQHRQAQIANTLRMAQGIGLASNRGKAAAPATTPGGTATNNPAGSGLPMATGKTAKTAQTPPAVGQPATGQPVSATVTRESLEQQYGPLGPGGSTSYQLNRAGGRLLDNRTPFAVNLGPSGFGGLNLYSADRLWDENTRATMLATPDVTETSIAADMNYPIKPFDISGLSADDRTLIGGLQPGFGVTIGGTTYFNNNGKFQAAPGGNSGIAYGRVPVQLQ